MKRFLALVALSLSTALVSAQSVTSRSLTTSSTRDVGFISQTIRIDGTSSFEVSVAPLTLSNQGYGTRKLSVATEGSPFTLPDPVAIPRGGTSSAIALKEGGFWTTVEYMPFKDRVATWLRSRGVSQAYYTFTQEVPIQSAAGVRTMKLSFLASIDSTGRSTHGTIKLTDKDPLVVEARYTPLKAAAGLPETWKYPNAGTIEWRLLDQRYNELTGWKTINVNGAYDNPDDGDPLSAVPCLVDNRNPGCAPGVTSVKDLMEQNAASFALLNYIRRIEPSYEVNDKDEQVPKSVIYVSERKWACNVLNHKGNFGMEVLLQADQFAVYTGDPVFSFQKVSESGDFSIAPTTSYNVSLSALDLGGKGPEQVMLAPIQDANPANNWWLLTDADKMKNVGELPPLVVDASATIPLSFSLTPDFILHATYGAGDIRDYVIGTPSMSYWSGTAYDLPTNDRGWGGGTGYTTEQFDNTITFNLDDVRSVQEFLLMQVSFDDWLRVAVNGTIVYIGPKGGNTLTLSEMVYYPYYNSCQAVGSQYVCGEVYCATFADRYFNRCTLIPTTYHPACYYERYAVEGFKGRTDWEDRWSCRTASCPVGAVENILGSTTYNAGCHVPSTGTGFDVSPLTDIKPYLKTGSNVIHVRAILAGSSSRWTRPDKGGALLRFRTQICNAPS